MGSAVSSGRFAVRQLVLVAFLAAGALSAWLLRWGDGTEPSTVQFLAAQVVALLLAVGGNVLVSARSGGGLPREQVNSDTLAWDAGPGRVVDHGAWAVARDSAAGPMVRVASCPAHRPAVVAGLLRGAAHDGFAAVRVDSAEVDAVRGDFERAVRARAGLGRGHTFGVPRAFRVAFVADGSDDDPSGAPGPDVVRSIRRFVGAWPGSLWVAVVDGGACGACADPAWDADAVEPDGAAALAGSRVSGGAWRYLAGRLPALLLSVLAVTLTVGLAAVVTGSTVSINADAWMGLSFPALLGLLASCVVVGAFLVMGASLHLNGMPRPVQARQWVGAAAAALVVGVPLAYLLHSASPHEAVGWSASLLVVVLVVRARGRLSVEWWAGAAGAFAWVAAVGLVVGADASVYAWAVVAGVIVASAALRGRTWGWVLACVTLAVLAVIAPAPESSRVGPDGVLLWWEWPELSDATGSAARSVGWCVVAALVVVSVRRALSRFERVLVVVLLAGVSLQWAWPSFERYADVSVLEQFLVMVVLVITGALVVQAVVAGDAGRGWRMAVLGIFVVWGFAHVVLRVLNKSSLQLGPIALLGVAAAVGIVAHTPSGQAALAALRRWAAAVGMARVLDGRTWALVAAAGAVGLMRAMADDPELSSFGSAARLVGALLVVLVALACRYGSQGSDPLLWSLLVMLVLVGWNFPDDPYLPLWVGMAVFGGPGAAGRRSLSKPRWGEVPVVVLLGVGVALVAGVFPGFLVALVALFVRPAELSSSWVVTRRRDWAVRALYSAIALLVAVVVVVLFEGATLAGSGASSLGEVAASDYVDALILIAALTMVNVAGAAWMLGTWQQAGWALLSQELPRRFGPSVTAHQMKLARREGTCG
ncbi:hypothetical protein [Cellulomonas fengjieae]|uniref:Uncharacterized protein n=1 Tax=Cellulomonas fengjieae TaxID=2819978 RepID=A0ABS3SED8_9CELL|nr:hypothetical protein [Cellulomonas fengjieae]MBO3084097.1 hypothetical protein [Cellulomonas fengjieae]QVI64648.1 hypothetical protein KG102_10670 [Cellulomonas fengjieae]